MTEKPIIALMYDFDHTLSPKDMQEYGFIPGLGMSAGEFWDACNRKAVSNNMDGILAYMLVMIEQSIGKQMITREMLTSMGKDVKLFDGVRTWFSRINAYAEQKGAVAEHYILSSGLKEIIEGTPIADEFKEIFAASFVYNDNGVPYWPAMAVNYTSKTQFIFRINKGVLDVTNDEDLNGYMLEDKRPVPFRNMIYIGDGLTDVPCMKTVKVNGGYSIAVYQGSHAAALKMLKHNRVDYIAPTDYSEGKELEQTVFEIIDSITAVDRTVRRHIRHSEIDD